MTQKPFAPPLRFAIEKGYDVPRMREKIRASLSKDLRAVFARMVPGDSFKLDEVGQTQIALGVAKRIRITITTRKLEGGGVRVWLVRRKAKS